jgi:tRNA G46 methylase TrmB
MIDWLNTWNGDVIIDAGCGVGQSTLKIAAMHPQAKVVGVDKSIARLSKHKSYVKTAQEDGAVVTKDDAPTGNTNYLLLQADLNDFWRLLAHYIESVCPKWQVIRQYILYPNPYPKKNQLSKRWHGSALFPTIVGVCANIELRSNWQIYLQECAVAAKFYGYEATFSTIVSDATYVAYTPFERKYIDANQTCFKLVIRP